MPERQFEDSVVRADRWSKAVALVVAIGVFLLSVRLTADQQFGSIVAATVAIGTRLYIPYHASMSVPEPDRIPIHAHPDTGSYHHGAVGGALAIAPFASLAVMTVHPAFLPAIGAGVVVGVVVYWVLYAVLPTE
ncbi:hypothetical protein [Natronorarus salvus]|uniref:hypothetical protein n=1 Tax=Natronorarus salvus TaxID=3117733 RepID=UPI002F260A77